MKALINFYRNFQVRIQIMWKLWYYYKTSNCLIYIKSGKLSTKSELSHYSFSNLRFLAEAYLMSYEQKSHCNVALTLTDRASTTN